MKANIQSRFFYYTIIFLLLSTSLNVMAQEDGPGTGFEGGGSVEQPVAPIGKDIIWLGIAGIGLAWYVDKKIKGSKCK